MPPKEITVPIRVSVDFQVTPSGSIPFSAETQAQAMAYIAKAIEHRMMTTQGALEAMGQYGFDVTKMLEPPKPEVPLSEMEKLAVPIRPTAWQRLLKDEDE